MAFGALHTLAAAKLSVPDQVRVIGFDNIEEGHYSTPAFDTVDPGAAQTSKRILDIILSKKPFPEQHISIPFQIINRTQATQGNKR